MSQINNVDATLGLKKAIDLIKQAATPDGFVASVTNQDNYQRIWSRDGAVISLAAIQTKDDELIQTVRATIKTLQKHQGPHGEIPSNVDPVNNKTSYGGTAGRVDADLWFVIIAHRYWQYTQDEEFLSEVVPALQRIEFLLGAWEFNNKGLLYIPETGDWADEYLQHGYVLYDQVLYYRALLALREMYQVTNIGDTKLLSAKAAHLKDLIRANYWFDRCDPDEVNSYHPVIFKRGCEMAKERGLYWMSYFSPTAYGYQFDAMANVLVSLFGIAEPDQSSKVDHYIEERVINPAFRVLPAFSPVIEPADKDWQQLKSNYSNAFKNEPHEYQNGGLWSLLSGFYVADLAARNQPDKAKKYLAAIHEANHKDTEGGEWGFYEYLNGKTFEPGGTRLLSWSASAAVIGHYAIEGTPPLLPITET